MNWEFCRKAQGDKKYVICNADEGDPGAFMDRSILEGDPHAIIEGMTLGAYAMGADEGYIYCRAEYPLAIKRLVGAITHAEEFGLIGDNVMDTDFSFHLHIKEGAGAFVCGEETALLASIEGERGMPRPRPPFPANKGLWGKPSNINNVESGHFFKNNPRRGLAGMPPRDGKVEGDKGLRPYRKVQQHRPGGSAMKRPIQDNRSLIGRRILKDRKFKAVQIGGLREGVLRKSTWTFRWITSP